MRYNQFVIKCNGRVHDKESIKERSCRKRPVIDGPDGEVYCLQHAKSIRLRHARIVEAWDSSINKYRIG